MQLDDAKPSRESNKFLALIGPISSSFVNKYGCRAVTIAGAILASACLLISSYAQNVLTLIVTIGLGVGCGLGLIYLPVLMSFQVQIHIKILYHQVSNHYDFFLFTFRQAIVSVSSYFEKNRSIAIGEIHQWIYKMSLKILIFITFYNYFRMSKALPSLEVALELLFLHPSLPNSSSIWAGETLCSFCLRSCCIVPFLELYSGH